MLQTWLSSIPAIVLLRSDRVLDLLLRSGREGKRVPEDELKRMIERACDSIHPNHHRKDDIRDAVSLSVENSLGNVPGGYAFDFLGELFDEYWVVEGSSVVARAERLIDHARLLARVHPYPVIGHRLARLLREGRLDRREIAAIAERTTQLALAPPPPSRHFAENHLHLNGAGDPGFALLFLAGDEPLPAGFYTSAGLDTLPDVADLPLIQSGRLTIGQLVEVLRLSLRWTDAVTTGASLPANSLAFLLGRIAAGRPLAPTDRPTGSASALRLGSPRNLAQYLLQMALSYQQDGAYNHAFLVRCVLLHVIEHMVPPGDPSRLLIRMGIHAVNLLRAFMVMGCNVGLTNFVDYFDSTLRDAGRGQNPMAYRRNMADNLYGNGTTWVDGKISPSRNGYVKDLGILADALDSAATAHRNRHRLRPPGVRPPIEEAFPLAFRGEQPDGAAVPPPAPYHFTIHFLRQRDEPLLPAMKDWKRLPARFEGLRRRLREQAEKLDAFLSSPDAARIPAFDHALAVSGADGAPAGRWRQKMAFRNREELSQRRINFTNLVVAIDVAGQETATEPEVYAPAIRFLRRDATRRRPINGASSYARLPERHRPLRLSVHAGEDFSHILTGLRRIDETVLFYNMGSGDRLGHALALGIPPKVWASRCPEVLIPKGDHLDNLVWLHRRLLELSKFHPAALTVACRYEDEIRRLSVEVYGLDDGRAWSLDVLVRAWERRSACPLFINEGSGLSSIEFGDYASIARQPEPAMAGEYDRSRKLLDRYHFDAGTRRRRSAIQTLRIDGWEEASRRADVADAELDVWEALQDFLMTEYDRRGIVIECNPSSNVFTAKLDDFHEHPIFRWNPLDRTDLNLGGRWNRFGLRNGPIHVCVNSDDPAIFCTTLPNEFLMLEMAAQRWHGCSRARAEEWAEALRQGGIALYARTHINL